MFQNISAIGIFHAKEVVLRFFVESFCLTVPKQFLEEPFCVSEKLPVSNNIIEEGERGGITISVLSRLTGQESFVG